MSTVAEDANEVASYMCVCVCVYVYTHIYNIYIYIYSKCPKHFVC